ncbi:FAD-dependent oxidoreductase [Kamptonema sp. UHCC 0994]|uniref:FAD-dependent oxidoreductase n=1 Tax=Kamptonema sp. UHCC 0994 TaxID=3031329 RepID=UPI0023BAABC1|nr:FAD-dependent oxidoreductase [Kamptonema sp. UHCC 0994]MDF0556072.1 FAD-dependent oxidoreductase [Kamptonema sp. UHCC 0994]
MNELKADILVVGGGTGGTAAAIQAARRGAKTILISEFSWLGGMLTTAGVSAPDGNELVAFQTGLWGAFLKELQQQQPGGLDSAWVSFFTYDPRIGAKIFADWVKQLPNLYWIAGQTPQEVLKKDNKIVGVRFEDFTIHAQITLDATELGDLLAIAEIPYRWGWEFQAEWGETSAPIAPNILTETYPVQAPTWVVIMQDFGADAIAPEITPPPIDNPSQFVGAWDNYGPEKFLNYGRLPGNRFMINWPLRGNDYGEGVNRLIESESSRREFLQESLWHTQSFARFIQNKLGSRYGLAEDIFPTFKMVKSQDGENFANHQLPITNYQLPITNYQLPITNSAFALHPYYRESRRLQGLDTIKEQDILPIASGNAASLPVNANGECLAIAIANYANDHHYTSGSIPLQPKSLRWGGRWTGTPFTIPYTCLIPAETDGLLTCEKNISVSHIANGATRLQPAVMVIGQAAGMAAALCIERGIQPRELPVRMLQEALLQDPIAPAAIIPLFNLTPNHPDWLYWQRYYLDRPTEYTASGNCPCTKEEGRRKKEEGITNYQLPITNSQSSITNYQFSGIFYRRSEQDYQLAIAHPSALANQTWKLVTLHPEIDSFLQNCESEKPLTVWGRLNFAGGWLLIEATQ